MNPRKISSDSYNFANVAKFRKIWSHCGCGSVVRAVASDVRGVVFEYRLNTIRYTLMKNLLTFCWLLPFSKEIWKLKRIGILVSHRLRYLIICSRNLRLRPRPWTAPAEPPSTSTSAASLSLRASPASCTTTQTAPWRTGRSPSSWAAARRDPSHFWRTLSTSGSRTRLRPSPSVRAAPLRPLMILTSLMIRYNSLGTLSSGSRISSGTSWIWLFPISPSPAKS